MRQLTLLTLLLITTYTFKTNPNEVYKPNIPTERQIQTIIQIESNSALNDPQIAAENMPTFSPEGEELVKQMVQGFVKRINREGGNWYECGQLTSEENKVFRTEKIVRYTLAAIRQYDMSWLNPWAILAIIYHESRGDQCAIGPFSRQAAKQLRLISQNKPANQWSKEDIITVIDKPRWKRSRGRIGADLGLGQQVWSAYARILDPQGDLVCGGKDLRCRVPTIDEMLSVEDGPRILVTGMLTRRIWHRTNQPWLFWKGTARDPRYDMRISRLITALGGKHNAKAVW
jgi:hypothetical protein